MNKKQFISELEKRLKVLNENERKDIINEYSDIINEKVKNGETEEQAVLEFGNIDSLVKEILESYKINPNYDNGFSKKAKEVASNTEDFIKRGAKKLADTTTNVVNDFKSSGNTLTLETVFEIILKVFVFLIILAILRVPFYLLRSLGSSVLGGIFDPFDLGISVIWNIIMWFIYIICCVLVGIIFFKKYFNNIKGTVTNVEPANDVKKNASKIDNSVYSNIDTMHNQDNKRVEPKKSSGALSILLKICAIIFIMIPLCSIIVGLFTATGISLYFFIKGVPTLGIFIALLGLSIGSSWLFDVFNRLILTRRRIYIWPFFAGLIITITGGIIFISSLFEFTFYDKLPNVELKNYTETISIDNNSNLYIYDMYEKDIIIDDTLNDNEVIVSIDYYSELADVQRHENNDGRSDGIVLDLHYYQNHRFNFNETFNIVINDLKNHNVYNYGYLYKGKVTVKVNSNTRSKVLIFY